MPNQHAETWSVQHVELLKNLWAAGNSASQVSTALVGLGGEFSRCAVIGKVHRLGLPGRATTSRRNRSVVKVRRPRVAKRPVFKPVQIRAAAPVANVTPLMLTIGELKASSCRWPFGDPRSSDFGYCGNPKTDGSRYCECHRAAGTRRAA